MSNLTVLAAASSSSSSGMSLLTSFLPMLIILVVFYFMLIRPQSKKDKALKKMREELSIGDEITTIGGIVGLSLIHIFLCPSSGGRSFRLY